MRSEELSEELATKIGNLVSSISVWQSSVESSIATYTRLTGEALLHACDQTTVYMKFHNDDGRALNEILGYPAVHLYIDSVTNEEH